MLVGEPCASVGLQVQPPGQGPLHLTAKPSGCSSANARYEFWVYSVSSGQRTGLGSGYQNSPTIKWMPGTAGQYYQTVWARLADSLLPCEVYALLQSFTSLPGRCLC